MTRRIRWARISVCRQDVVYVGGKKIPFLLIIYLIIYYVKQYRFVKKPWENKLFKNVSVSVKSADIKSGANRVLRVSVGEQQLFRCGQRCCEAHVFVVFNR